MTKVRMSSKEEEVPNSKGDVNSFESDHLPENRKQNLTMNSALTVYLISKDLSIDHPVGHVEDVTGQSPGGLFIGVEDGLAGHPKTHQDHQHDDHKI